MAKNSKRKKTSSSHLPYGQEAELLRLMMSVSAIRQRMNEDLDAIEAEIQRLLPESKPQSKITDWRAFLRG